jgi:hypothetical protein
MSLRPRRPLALHARSPHQRRNSVQMALLTEALPHHCRVDAYTERAGRNKDDPETATCDLPPTKLQNNLS